MKVANIIILFLLLFFNGFSQTHNIYIVGVPNLTSRPKVVNPSPANIYGTNTFGLETKLLYDYTFNSTFGLILGINAGLVNCDYNIEAPYSAFGTHKDFGTLKYNTFSTDYHYLGGTIGSSYNGSFKRNRYHIELGLTLRIYPNDIEGDTTGAAFNREVPYDPWDPSSGPADFVNAIPAAAKKLFPHAYLSLSFPMAISRYSTLHLGITKNWSFKLLGKGNMFVQYNDQFYYGEYSPKTSYLGLDVRYGYTFGKRKNSGK